MPGRAPKPENEVEERLVYCIHCGRVYLSRSKKPVCAACRSKKVRDYKLVASVVDLHQARLAISGIAETLAFLQEQQAELSEIQKASEKKEEDIIQFIESLKTRARKAQSKQTDHKKELEHKMQPEAVNRYPSFAF